ncbi:MAG: UDP-N-acetylmuramate--L-alanine ligase [Chitinophagales bacterium]
MAVDTEQRIHMVGIGGAGMSGIAHILKEMGKEITGSDLQRSETTDRLEAMGIRVFSGHSSANLNKGTDLVVVSSAIPGSNPEMKKAQRLGIPVVKRGDMLASLVNSSQGIAVSGAHGKTTTTSMMAMLLEENGFSPSFIIGGELKETNIGSKLGRGDYFVAEADESDASFLKLNPYVVVVTNVEDDHLDFYRSIERLKDAFRQFIGQVKTGGFAVLCYEDVFLRALKGSYRHLIYYGASPEADYYYTDLKTHGWGNSFTVWHHDKELGRINLTVPGCHNVQNALAAAAVANELGIPFPGIRQTLKKFKGAKRRFQLMGSVNDILIVDDYAHHPTEIEATLKGVRQFHKGRLVVVFQPHRYTRTKILGTQFGESFRESDLLIVTGIYGAGEEPIEGVTGDIICRSALEKGCNACYVADAEDVVDLLKDEVKNGDMVIFMGAGDIWKVGYKTVAVLESTSPSA